MISPKFQPPCATTSTEDGSWYLDQVDCDLLPIVLVAQLERRVTLRDLENALTHSSAAKCVVGIPLAYVGFKIGIARDHRGSDGGGLKEVLEMEIRGAANHGQESTVSGGESAVGLESKLLRELPGGIESELIA